MKKPMVNGDLVDSATMLLLADDCSLIEGVVSEDEATFTCEPALDEARKAASAYLVRCFEYAAEAFEADDA